MVQQPCELALPTTSARPEMATHVGEISMRNIIQSQPSMRKPLEEGVLIKVLHGQVEKAVPGLFAMVSRVWDVMNSHYMLQTTLPSCTRSWSIASYMQQSNPDGEVGWDKVARLAVVGMLANARLALHTTARIARRSYMVCAMALGSSL